MGSITTGSHSPLTNEIMFDIPTYKLLGEEAMKHRMGHEMLHEFGLEEKEVLSKENDYYQKIRNIDIKPLRSLYKKITQAHVDLESRVTQFFLECPEQLKCLEECIRVVDARLFHFGLSIEALIDATIVSTHPMAKVNAAINIV